MSGKDYERTLALELYAGVVIVAFVAVGLWELAQWVSRHLRVEWIA